MKCIAIAPTSFSRQAPRIYLLENISTGGDCAQEDGDKGDFASCALLQMLIPVFSLQAGENTGWRFGHQIDLQLVQVRTQRSLLRKRGNDISAFQKSFVPLGMIKMSEKSFWCVTNKQASSQSCCIWGALPRQGERAERKWAASRTHPCVPAQPFLGSVLSAGGQSCKCLHFAWSVTSGSWNPHHQ